MSTAMDPRTSVAFADVRVEPARTYNFDTCGGGPVLPADAPPWARFIRNGETLGDLFVPRSGPATFLPGPYVWGGVAVQHPGHFVSEQAPRLLFSACLRPDDKVLFVLPRGTEPEDLPEYFFDVCAYLVSRV